jgi:hypothetical protein
MWRKENNICICVHTQENKIKREKKEKEKRKREKKEKKKEREKRKEERERKRDEDPRQGKKDIMRDDKSSEDQEKCKEGCDDVENESSIFHTMCNPTSRTSLVP